MLFTSRRTATALTAGGLTLAFALTGCGGSGGSASEDGSTISVLVDNTELATTQMNALAEAFEANNPDIDVDVQTRPAGGEGDNVVKTRLATDDMTDMFAYNTGSLFQALSPDQNLMSLSDEEWVSKLDENFQTVVSTENGMYGVPLGQSFGGAILYNKDVYEQLGLEIPKTWDEFIANSEAVKEAGDIAPIIQTYADTWTSQLLVLGDFANVLAEDPDWAEKYTNNEAKYSDPPAFDSFEHLEQAGRADLFNENFASATYDDGVRMIATGEGAHYPILTFIAAPIVLNYPEAADRIGSFPIPGDSQDSNPLTVWQPGAVYVPKSVEGAKLESVKKFLDFLVTPESCEIQSTATAPQGPYVIEGCDLPEDVPAFISDMQPFFDSGNTGLALEFLSPIKGPALEQITVAVGSGITSATDGATQYDEDVRKQAQQLGLDGW